SPTDGRLPATAHIQAVYQAAGNLPAGSQWLVHRPAGTAADGWLLTLVTPLETAGGELLAVLAEDIDIHNLYATYLQTILLGAAATSQAAAAAHNFFIATQGDDLPGQDGAELTCLLAALAERPDDVDPAVIHEVLDPAGDAFLIMVAP